MYYPNLVHVLLLTIFAITDARELPFPSEYCECLQRVGGSLPAMEYAGSWVVGTCINDYLGLTRNLRWQPTVSNKAKQTFNHLLTEFEEMKNGTRKKRSTGLNVRREYRKLSGRQRRRFHRAVNRMKIDGLYDEIAAYHAERSLAAHAGPAFPAWHRVYISLFENALQMYDPTVTLPYWDSRLEATLYDRGINPDWSRLWGRKFLGNGDELVTIGSFRVPTERDLSRRHVKIGNWSITRRLFSNGPLADKDRYDMLFGASSMSQILLPAFIPEFGNFELIHNAVHVWVGGDMSRIDTSTNDICFFLTHSFFDYMFEELRTNMRNNFGTDPANDYPDISGNSVLMSRGHHENETMTPFTNFINKDGYADFWTQSVFTYEKSPVDSPVPCKRCRKKDYRPPCLVCGRHLRCVQGRCEPKLLKKNFVNKYGFGPSIPRRKRDTSECDSDSYSALQNNYAMNGDANTYNWKYVAVKILYRRPMGLRYNTYPIKNGKADTCMDSFNPEMSSNLFDELNITGPGTFDYCGLATLTPTIYVNADGLNYFGASVEEVGFDGRLPIDCRYVYIPVANPMARVVQVSLFANDHCGRLCSPKCVQGDGTLAPCTGFLELDSNSTTWFGDSPAHVIEQQFDFSGDIPMPSDGHIALMFDCDNSGHYYWEGHC